MNITLLNTEDAGMPETTAGHCRILLERRIRKLYPEALPEPGEEIAILYSEADPLWEREEVDDNAYDIYFTVESAEIPDGAGREAAEIQLALLY